MTTLLFPGQGSQKKGMGGDLFDEFSELTAIADKILNSSIKELCLNDPNNKLNQTQYTQPALFVVSALSYLKHSQTNPRTNYLLGHSVGEYAALFAAQCFDFSTGVKLVQKRGELMSRASGGAMAAIIGIPAQFIETVLHTNNLPTIDIANYNSPDQIVISGLNSDIEHAINVLKPEAKKCVKLNVSGAFHSRYMQSAQDEFAQFINEIKFSAPTIPVISNVTAKPYDHNNIADNLIKQITHSVRWAESMLYVLNADENEFIEIGPGKVLTGLARRIIIIEKQPSAV